MPLILITVGIFIGFLLSGALARRSRIRVDVNANERANAVQPTVDAEYIQNEVDIDSVQPWGEYGMVIDDE